MDHNLVFAKTPSGERAMLERTRIMPRNVRMVLILVDSQSSVGDLCLKTGNPQLTESALRELEKGGFIEPRGEPAAKPESALTSRHAAPSDSLWEEGKKVAQEIRAAANHKKGQSVASRTTGEAPLTPSAAAICALESDPSQTARSDRFSAPPPSAAPSAGYAAASLPEPSTSSIAQRIKGFLSKPGGGSGGPDRVAPAQSIPAGQRGGDPGVGSSAPSEAVLTKARELGPVRHQRPLAWPRMALLFAVMLLAGVVLSALWFPYERFLPELEIAMSKVCGRPVKVGSLRVDLYPKSALLLGDVRIGDEPGALRIAEVRLLPMIAPLLSGRAVIGSVRVSGVSLPARLVVALPAIFGELARSPALAQVDHIALENAEISLGGLALSQLQGEATRSADGQLQSLKLASSDGRLHLVATPLPQGFALLLEGVGWRPAPDSSMLFDSINLSGVFENGAFSIKSMALRVFDGLLEGVAVLRSERSVNVSGELTFKRINGARLAHAAGLGERLSGEGSGTLRFFATADSFAALRPALNVDGEFVLSRGSLRGIDLSEAARRVSATPTQGGETKFEHLSGRIHLTPDGYVLSELLINSGLMQSSGRIEISPDSRLSGRIEVRMRGTVNQTRVPLSVGGTLAAPTVQTGRSD